MAPKTPIEKVAFPRVVESDIDKKMMPEALYAALDLGTNSCRMLIAQPKGAEFHVIDSFAKSVQLGSGLEKTGRLSRDSINRTIQALQVCKQKLDKYDVKFARLVATEACRRAKNSKEFISKVFQQTGLKLNIIDTEEEARLAVISCAPLVSRKSEQLLVVDIGGGSTELVWIDLTSVPSGERPKSIMRLHAGFNLSLIHI